MEVNAFLSGTKVDPSGFVVDLSGLRRCMDGLYSRRSVHGVLYYLACILLLVVLAMIVGEDRLSGVAGRVKHRADVLAEALGWSRPRAPHRTTYSRILAHGVDLMTDHLGSNNLTNCRGDGNTITPRYYPSGGVLLAWVRTRCPSTLRSWDRHLVA